MNASTAPRALAALVLGAFFVSPMQGEEILFTEFFEEVFSLDTTNGTIVDLVDTPDGTLPPFGQHLVVAGDGSAFVSDFGRLFRFDQGSSTPYTEVVDLGGASSFGEVTRGASATGLVGLSGGDILSIDPVTGTFETRFTQTFFSASDVVVDAGGRIFATEFFSGLGFIDSGSSDFIAIGDFNPLDLDHLDIGTDGLIYASTGFDNGFVAIDPETGQATDLAANAYTFIDDLRVSDDNVLFFAGTVGDEDGIFRLGEDGSVLAVTTGDGDDFFNPQDLDFASSSLRATTVPEPSGLLALAAAGGLIALRRRASRERKLDRVRCLLDR